MRRLWVACIGVAIIGASLAGSAQAVTLIRPDGAKLSMRSPLRRWADHMHVASVHGPITISNDWAACAWGDATPACLAGHTIFWKPGTGQFALYHELGHAFDDRYLHWWDRWFLMRLLSYDIGEHLRIWDDPYVATHASEATQSVEYFADAYANCAQNDRVNEDPAICSYINRVGRIGHAARRYIRPVRRTRKPRS